MSNWVDIKVRGIIKKRLDGMRKTLLKNSPPGTKMGYSELINYLLDNVKVSA